MKPILLTKPGCDKCDYVKERMPELDIELIDLTTPKGMALDVKYDLTGSQMPILIHENTPHVGAITVLKKLKEIEKFGEHPEATLPDQNFTPTAPK